MKVGIITLPFNWNYGGILQNYALQEVLTNLGHTPVTLNRNDKIMPLKQKLFSYSRRVILKTFMGKDVVVRTWPSQKELKYIRQHTDRFIEENIKTTSLFRSEKELRDIEKFNFHALITGSDQVWRPKYSPSIENHFLGFLPSNAQIKRIAYAPSFGTDNWEFNNTQTQTCSELLKKFIAVSAREESGVELIKKYLKVDAQLTLDPTMLIPKEKYIKLVEKDNTPPHNGTLFNYVLDGSADKQKFIKNAAEKLHIKAFSSTAQGSFRDLGMKNIEKCVFPPVTQWLRGFMDAEFVITDSFHGTVFSIVFNKPFLSIGNEKRGLSRFQSLLKIFNLEERLVSRIDNEAFEKLEKPIDFNAVNKLLEINRKNSLRFLKSALTE